MSQQPETASPEAHEKEFTIHIDKAMFKVSEPEMTGAGEEIAILGPGEVAAPIEILGETTPAAAMGHYQTEMTGANPLEVMGAGGYAPYSGAF